MKKNKEQKVAIISGARSGIGLATSKYLLSKGIKVYGISLHEDDLGFHIYAGDVNDESRMIEIFEDVFRKEGHIDIVINNAGIGISGAVENTTKDRIEKIFNTNIISIVDICKIAIPYLRKSKGKIINTSSVAASAAISFQACYSATKAALESFSIALSKEVRSWGIKICCVRPGDTKTGFTDARLKNEKDNPLYGDLVKKKTEKMEKYERQGADPLCVSKVMYKCIKRKNPPLVCSVGFANKLVSGLIKILPTRWSNYLIYKFY